MENKKTPALVATVFGLLVAAPVHASPAGEPSHKQHAQPIDDQKDGEKKPGDKKDHKKDDKKNGDKKDDKKDKNACSGPNGCGGSPK